MSDLIERLRTSWDVDRSIISQTENWMKERREAAAALAAKDAEIAKLHAENVVLMEKNAGALDLAVSENARAEKAEAALSAKDAEIAKLRSGGDDFDALIADARAEAEKAMRKFPQPNYVISKVAEEAGEVVKAAIHCAEGRETVENLRGEMKQLIAMIYRLWVEGDGVHGLPPARAALTGEKG